MDAKEIDEFEKVEAQLLGFHEEVQNLAKKTPDGVANKFKLRHINSVLAAANRLMTKPQRPFPDFEQFNEDELPTNSDILLILRQYAGCFEEARSASIQEAFGEWYWLIKGRKSGRRSRPPAKLG